MVPIETKQCTHDTFFYTIITITIQINCTNTFVCPGIDRASVYNLKDNQ